MYRARMAWTARDYRASFGRMEEHRYRGDRVGAELKPSRFIAAIWVALLLYSTTFCSGATERSKRDSGGAGQGGAGQGGAGAKATGGAGDGGGGVSGSASMAGYVGFGGHTGQCYDPDRDPCVFVGGCAPPPPECGGAGGISGYPGFAGHTGVCLSDPCSPGCGAPCGGGGNGGMPAAGGLGGADDAGGADQEGGAPAAPPAPEARQSQPQSPPERLRVCYTLGGYDADPCLPPDPALLAWLGGVPPTCDGQVMQGPFPGPGPTRACCYEVVCEAPALPGD
jgi:hypothetical protein